MSLAGIRAGLAANLSTIPDAQISPVPLAEPSPPTILVADAEIAYDLAFNRGWDELNVKVQALVSLTGDLATLDAFMAPNGQSSVKAALQLDQTLAGHADQVHVTTCRGPLLTTIAGVAYLMAEWECMVYANGAT